MHHDGNILKDIQSGYVFIQMDDGQNEVGTVTVKTNEISRLFVLPQYQKQGFGRGLLDFAESRIAERYHTCELDASLPAKAIYIKRGYVEIETHSIQTESGDFLCYDVMRKKFHS